MENLLPLVSETIYSQHELNDDGEITDSKYYRQAPVQKEGSFCTTIKIRANGHRLSVCGNPSRYNRIDNLFGYTSLDPCFGVYNTLLGSMGLPPLTKTTQFYHRQTKDGSIQVVGNGAKISRIDVTTNKAAGQGNESTYIKALSTVNYRNSIPKLFENGQTAGW
ncbi:uncharacterized protein TRIADDRAFT_63035, partial [Trichoplax adhaerens]